MTKTMKKTDEFVCDMRPRCARRAHGNLKQRHLTRNRGGLASSSPLACRRRYLNNAKKKKLANPIQYILVLNRTSSPGEHVGQMEASAPTRN